MGFNLGFKGLTQSVTREAERMGANNNPSDSHFGGNRIEYQAGILKHFCAEHEKTWQN